MNETSIEIFDTEAELARAAANLIAERVQGTLAKKDVFTIALSGGSTPTRLFELLADKSDEFVLRIPWEQIHVFWVDERLVQPDHPDSNFGMANRCMFRQLNLPLANVHRVRGELAVEAALADYETKLRSFFKLLDDEVPRFDLILLGLGKDGHTASIFPGSEVLQEQKRLVASPWVPVLNASRITLTLPVLNNAKTVAFLVSGANKADIVCDVVQGPSGRFPAQAVKPRDGELVWFVDRAAAGKLPFCNKAAET